MEAPKLENLETKISAQVPELRKVLQDKYKLEVPANCDQFLARCLRLKDGNMEKAIKLVKAFHSATLEISKWDSALLPSAYNDAWYNRFVAYSLAVRDSLGRRVLVLESGKWDIDLMNFDDCVLACWMFAVYAVAESLEDQRNGYVLITNFTNFGMQKCWAIKQRRLLSLARWAHSGIVGRIKGIHFIHHPKIISLIYSACKPFMSAKINDRIHFHDDMDSLQRGLGMNIKYLPKALGGELEAEQSSDKQFRKALVNSDEYFRDLLEKRFPAY